MVNRRSFFKAGAAVPAALASAQPGGRLRIGIIGFGGRGTYLFGQIARSGEPQVEVVAVCDVYAPARARAAAMVEKEYGKPPFLTTRFEELLKRADVDAVIISAPDFTHSPMLAAAMAAGKDAYCEKPMGTNLEDARKAYRVVKASKQVVQIGTQRRSEPPYIAAAEAIRSGLIGKVTRADMQVHFQEPRWRRDFHMIKPEDIDWDAFTMGKFNKPFDARLFREWQLFPETTNGIPGLWMSHFIDLPSWFLGQSYPKACVSLGGVYLWKDGRVTSDVFQSLVEYEDCLVSFAMSLTNTAGARHEWYGTRGTLDVDALTVSGAGSRDPNRLTEARKLETKPVESHMANWLRCVRARQTPRADIQAGFSHAVALCMAAEALRTGRRIGFNPQTLEFT